MKLRFACRVTVLFASFFLCFCGFNLYAQSSPNPQFEYFLNPDEGITGYVHALLQDRHGFIWIGTTNGLKRYDGYTFKSWFPDPDDPNSLTNRSVSFLYEDSQGYLWVGTFNRPRGGPGILNRLDRQTGRFEHFKHNPGDPHSISSDAVTNVFEDSKNNLWVCTEGGGINLFDRQTGRFEVFQFGKEESESKRANSIYSVLEDSWGILWMDSKGVGLSSLDPSTGVFKRYRYAPSDTSSISNDLVWAILEDSNRELWIGTEKGLNRLNRKTGRFERFLHDPNDNHSLSHPKAYHLFEDTRKGLWVGTPQGLNRMDRSTGKFQRFLQELKSPNSICGNHILPNSMVEDAKGNLWVRTLSSIAFFNREKEEFHCFQYKAAGGPTDILCDRSGNIWLGTNSEYSLTRMHTAQAGMQFYRNESDNPNSLMFYGGLSCFFEDSDGIIWFGSNAGLDRIDRTTGAFEHFVVDADDPSSITVGSLRCILEDSEGFLWVGGGSGSLDRLDRKTGKLVKSYPYDCQAPNTVNVFEIGQGLKDSKGNLWFGGLLGINKWDKNTELFQHFMPVPEAENPNEENNISAMIMDREGYIWAGRTPKGLCCLNPATGQFIFYRHDPLDFNSLSHDNVSALYEDSKGNLWVGTNIGLNRLDRTTGLFTRYFVDDGLPGPDIKGILEDGHGYLWISTDNGITKFDSKREIFQNFDAQDGLQWHYFTKGAHFRSPLTGELFFGGKNGFNIFHPDSMKVDAHALPVVFTSFSRYHQEDSQPFIDDFISEKEKIVLFHQGEVVSFEFAALNFRNTAKTKYKYQLGGFSDQWYELGNKRQVTFADLRPGKYTLQVMASNSYGVWSLTPAELAIQVLPPWYWSSWSKFLYLLIGTGLLFGLYRYQLKRKLALAEARNLKELDSVKTKFYTNITHEFRTPLTVIQGMSDQLIEKAGELPKEKIADNARIVKRNSAQLLTMVSQMLDLRRLESGNMPVNLVKGDVLQYFRYLTESFYSYANDKKVGLHFMTDMEELNIDYDPDKLMHIVSNLLSNAIKFTPEGGNVYFTAEQSSSGKEGQHYLVLKVKDTGIGISDDHLPFIFDRFYTSSHTEARKGEGTGIGLALTKELVKLMKGTIDVKSKLHEGTNFTVKLPITEEAETAAAQPVFLKDKILGLTGPAVFKEKQKSMLPAENGDLPLALIIEDNPDVVRYLSSCLENDYHIATALNGKTGVDIALEMIPDIIVSDVMMPEKDGYEVCEVLKNDERTSHIPILLLTAKADHSSKLEGFRKGADAYLVKPFDREELHVRLEQLIELRRKLQEHYGSLCETPSKAHVTIEDQFLLKVKQVIMDHLDDSEFDQEKLSRALALSRSQLFRKLKALTGKSTSHVVRCIRLMKAKELLLSTDLNVSEVAYNVGFKDLSYFSKCFIEEFGERPSAVRE